MSNKILTGLILLLLLNCNKKKEDIIEQPKESDAYSEAINDIVNLGYIEDIPEDKKYDFFIVGYHFTHSIDSSMIICVIPFNDTLYRASIEFIPPTILLRAKETGKLPLFRKRVVYDKMLTRTEYEETKNFVKSIIPMAEGKTEISSSQYTIARIFNGSKNVEYRYLEEKINSQFLDYFQIDY